MQLCTSLAIRYLYCISSRGYVFVQEAIKDFEFEFEFVLSISLNGHCKIIIERICSVG